MQINPLTMFCLVRPIPLGNVCYSILSSFSVLLCIPLNIVLPWIVSTFHTLPTPDLCNSRQTDQPDSIRLKLRKTNLYISRTTAWSPTFTAFLDDQVLCTYFFAVRTVSLRQSQALEYKSYWVLSREQWFQQISILLKTGQEQILSCSDHNIKFWIFSKEASSWLIVYLLIFFCSVCCDLIRDSRRKFNPEVKGKSVTLG